MISVNIAGCTLDGSRILSNVSFSLAKGQFAALVGPNGAGKTTLLRCLMGLYSFEGTVTLGGRDIRKFSRKEIAREISYVPQMVGALPEYSVRDFVLMARYPYQGFFYRHSPEEDALLEDVLERTGLAPFAARRISTLSGGERQKVLLAAALCQQSNLLLLDEPSAFLDPRHEQEIYDVLSEIHSREKKTILMVTHDLNRAALSSQRVLGLADGVLQFDGSPPELMTPAVLHVLYRTSFLLVPHPFAAVPMAVPRQRPYE